MAISKKARITSCKSLLNKEDCDHYKNRFKYVNGTMPNQNV